jgi:hypothetical protein
MVDNLREGEVEMLNGVRGKGGCVCVQMGRGSALGDI